MSAIGLYFSSIFRRSVHSTAVSYAAVIALTAITFIVFSMLHSHWETSQARLSQSAEAAAGEIPRYYTTPLYVNPFYALTASIMHAHQKFPDWLICALVFLVLGLLAAFFAFHGAAEPDRIRAAGEERNTELVRVAVLSS